MATSPLLFNQSQDQGNGYSPESAVPSSPVTTPMMRAAMSFINANQNQQPNPGSAIRTVNIGGHPILQTNSPGDEAANVNARVGGDLTNIANQYLGQKNMDNRQNFIQSVHQIMGATAPQQDKMNALLDLQTAHGQDYGLGVDAIAAKLGLNRPATAAQQDPATRIAQLLKIGQLNPDQAHSQAVQTIGPDYAAQHPELGTAIQDSANRTVLEQANQVVQKQFGPGYEINPDWVATGKGEMVHPKVMGISGDAALSQLPPDQARAALKQQNPGYADYLQKIADGTMTITGRGSKQIQVIKQDLAMLYPGIDEIQLKNRQDTNKDFTSGKESNNIKALNTSIGHLDTLNGLIDQLHNTPAAIWNGPAQAFESATGIGNNPAVKQFNVTKNALAGELAAVFKNSGGTDTEIANISKDINSADNPENLKAVVKSAVSLLNSRLGAIQNKWQNSFNLPGDRKFPVLSQKSQGIINKLGVAEEGGTPGAGDNGNQQDYSSLWN